MNKPKPKSKVPAVKPVDRSAVLIDAKSEADRYPAIARTLTRPEVGAAAVIEKWSPDTHDVNALASELASQVDAVNGGDMRRVEGLLLAQAQTLDAIFVNLMRRATSQTALLQWETYMRMGMKAQSQCRATLQALAEVKNPPVFAKQANFANGPQQINNGSFATSTRPPAHAGKAVIQQSKLLEDGSNGSTYMDGGATPAATRGNPAVEAMGAVERARDYRGKGKSQP
jgi:hypothetical protein